MHNFVILRACMKTNTCWSSQAASQVLGRQRLAIKGKFQPNGGLRVSSVSVYCPQRTVTTSEIQSQTHSCLWRSLSSVVWTSRGCACCGQGVRARSTAKCIIKQTYRKATIGTPACRGLIQVLKHGSGKTRDAAPTKTLGKKKCRKAHFWI